MDQGHDFVYHDFYKFKESGKEYLNIIKSRSLGENPYKNLLINGNEIVCSSVVMRSSIIREIGFFDEDPNCIAAEDYDYWLRVAKTSKKFMKIRGVWGKYREHKKNLSSLEKNLKYTQYLYNKYLIDIKKLSKVEPKWILKTFIVTNYYKKQYSSSIFYLIKYISNYPLNSLKYFISIISLKLKLCG